MELLLFMVLLAIVGALAVAFGADSRRDEPGLGAWVRGVADRAPARPERGSFADAAAEVVDLPAAPAVAADVEPRGRAA